jgi:hypothetical protein
MANVHSLVYTNPDIVHLRNRNIVEYDIASGGYSVSSAEGLLPADLKSRIDGMNKKQRQIALGMYTLDNPSFTKELHEAFKKYVAEFREANEIDEDNVISIKKDSLIFYDSPIRHDKFGEGNVHFTRRGKYSSYAYIDGKQYFFDGLSKKLDVKGLTEGFGKDDLVEEIGTVLGFDEHKTKDFIFGYMKELREAYLDRELAFGYYREMSAMAGYKIRDEGSSWDIYLEEVTEETFQRIDIQYNYEKVLVPLIGMVI